MSREWGLFFLILITINCVHAEKNTKKQNIKEQIAPDRSEFGGMYSDYSNPYDLKFTDKQVEKIELSLQTLLDECSELIGPQDNDKKHGVHLPRAVYIVISSRNFDDETLTKIQPSYLLGRWKKCSSHVSVEPYNLNSFEYDLVKLNSKNQQIEKKYEAIYLQARFYKFLHKLRYRLIPKSLIREYANQSGLTQFIQKQEIKTKKPLNHSELAEKYFGSKAKWQDNMVQFLDKKTQTLGIGVKND